MDSGDKGQNQRNPREGVSIFSALFMTYSWGMFKKRFANELVQEDLWIPLGSQRSEVLGTLMESAWNQELSKYKHTGKKPSLWRALLKTFFKRILFTGLILLFIETSLRLCQPILLGRMLRYFSDNSDVSRQEALLYGTGISLLTAVYVLGLSMHGLSAHMLALEIRVALSHIVYGKVLRLRSSVCRNPAGGNVINLLSRDIKNLPRCMYISHHMWLSPLLISVLIYLLWIRIGWPGLIGVAIAVSMTTLLMTTGKLQYAYQKKIAQSSDKRIKLVEGIILGVRSIKMYAWEKPFVSLVNSVRKVETQFIKKNSRLQGTYTAYALCNFRIVSFSVLSAMAFFDSTFTAENVFTTAALIYSLTNATSVLNTSYQATTEAIVLLKRIETYLLQEELPEVSDATINTDEDATNDALTMENVTTSWDRHAEPTLSNLSIRVKSGSLVTIIGPVGSGKTSLLHAILQELPILSGSFKVKGKLSYTSQEPWVFGATVRQNITFTRPYQEEVYNRVVQACALQPDLLQLPRGDLTRVGERGCSLSGGQKARISLARAVYNEADVYLLDDPLSAVDTHVAKHLFEECIMTYLKGKTRLLVTHQLQYIKEADHIVVVKNGKIKIQGSFFDITNSEFYIGKYIKSQESSSTNEEETNTYPKITISHGGVGTETSGNQSKKFAETMSKGNIKNSTYKEYLLSGSNYSYLIVLGLVFLIAQVTANTADYWISYWTKQEEAKNPEVFKYAVPSSAASNFLNQDAASYSHEIKFQENWTSSREFCMIVYSVIIVVLLVISFVKILMFYNACEASSNAIHNQVTNSIIRTFITFFDMNPSGRIMDRFSTDVGVIDEVLPKAIMASLQNMLVCVGPLVVACIVNYCLLPVVAVLTGVFIFFVRVYVATSTNIMRLEAICRSPVFVHMSATIQGLPTIRALKAQSVLKKEFHRHQDLYTSATYTYTVVNKTFAFYVDCLCAVYITCVVFSFLTLCRGSYAGNVGLVIVQSFALLAWLQYAIINFTAVTESMTCVERIMDYKYLEEESNNDTSPHNSAPPCWPDNGRIAFVNVSLKYMDDGPSILENINITIYAGEKVGIVGRTGAGKSSFILALLRLAKVEGSILIDDIDTRDVSLHDLRKNISIIPQDPFLFSGTMRENLDRFGEFHDDELLRALEDVEMKGMLKETDGLNTKVADKGDNFSVGQKQLLCLARAILRNNKILVLDEATANVDLRTDELIQKTLRTKFANCTVLTVAHRLNTIIDSDKVMVMDKGQLVEFDHPHLLLQNNEGIFYKMVQKTGQLNSLAEVASESYYREKTL